MKTAKIRELELEEKYFFENSALSTAILKCNVIRKNEISL